MAQFAFANQQTEKARSLFKVGNYWDAFLIFQAESKHDSYLDAELENCKSAITHQRQYRSSREMKLYKKAIEELEALLVLNPNDPDKYDIGVMANLQARAWQLKAQNQYYRKDAERLLVDARAYFLKALQNGIPSEDIMPKLKICEEQLSLVMPNYTTPTNTVDSDYPASPETSPSIERERKVIILEN